MRDRLVGVSWCMAILTWAKSLRSCLQRWSSAFTPDLLWFLKHYYRFSFRSAPNDERVVLQASEERFFCRVGARVCVACPSGGQRRQGQRLHCVRRKVFDSFRTDPRSGLALVWHRELDLMEPCGPWELGAVSCLPSIHWEARCRSRDVDERGEDGHILGGEITISEWIEGVWGSSCVTERGDEWKTCKWMGYWSE